MQLINFSSLFELLCAFNLTYIITGNLTDKNFVSLIIEKILRKYSSATDTFKEIENQIEGCQTSLNELIETISPSSETFNQHDIESKRLKSYAERIKQSKNQVLGMIGESYRTKAFVYLSFYLMFYCLLILLFAGANQSFPRFQSQFDKSLLIITIETIIVLCIGWFAIDKKSRTVGRTEGSLFNWHMVNGYKVIFGCIAILIFSSAIFPFCVKTIYIEDKYYNIYHNVLIAISILLPCSNFIIYFIKATRTSTHCKNNVEEITINLKDTYKQELKSVTDFITSCRYNNSQTPTVTFEPESSNQ